MNTKSPIFSGRKGFSLVELLVVIAVIAIIAAIAIPNIANITQHANIIKAQRNAQTVVSVATAALAAGYEPGTSWNVRSNIIMDLMSGSIRVAQTGTSGDKLMFKISEINTEDIPAIEGYIDVIREGSSGVVPIIEYVATGTVPPDSGN